VAFLVGADPLWVAGSETFIGELLEIAGARNVFGDLGRPYGAVSPEAVLARDPEILLAVEGTEVDERLLRGRRLVHVSPEVEIPGPNLAEAALEIERALRGATVSVLR
jgi:ABC-type Fe3+-hydroxamate transport system substrate-binding protein